MLWLAAYLTGFPPVGLHALRWTHGLAPMWSGLYLISTDYKDPDPEIEAELCQCPLGLIPHFYLDLESSGLRWIESVNALSGLYLISTKKKLLNSTGGLAPGIFSHLSRPYRRCLLLTTERCVKI